MARIAGVDLPRTKRVEIGLTYIYGIGRVRSNRILTDAGVSGDVRVKDLSEDDVRKISRIIEEQGGSKQFFLSGGFATVQPNSVLSINAVEGYPLEDFSAEVRTKTLIVTERTTAKTHSGRQEPDR